MGVEPRLATALIVGCVVLCLSSVDSNSVALIIETETTADPVGVAVGFLMTVDYEALDWGPEMK